MDKYKFRRVVAAVYLVTIELVSLIPNIEYSLAKINIQNDKNYNLENIDINKTEKICSLYRNAILMNNKLSSEDKDMLIDIVTNDFLKTYAKYFDEDTVINMCAVASTQTISKMCNYAKENFWYSGYYNPYFNICILYDDISNNKIDNTLHEQIHAYFKKGLFSSGLCKFQYARALNEGITTNIIKNNYYYEDTIISTIISLIIGNEKVLDYYFNDNIDGLKKELSQYISYQDINYLFINMDISLYKYFYQMYLVKDNLTIDMLYDIQNKSSKELLTKIKPILVKLYENKTGKKMEDDNLGKIILNSDAFNYDENAKIKYSVNYIDDKYVCICFYNMDKSLTKKYIMIEEELNNVNICKLINNVNKIEYNKEYKKSIK